LYIFPCLIKDVKRQKNKGLTIFSNRKSPIEVVKPWFGHLAIVIIISFFILCFFLLQISDDIDGKLELSLEEAKFKSTVDKHVSTVNQQKKNVLDEIARLKLEFKQIFYTNENTYNSSYFGSILLDERVENYLENILIEKMDLVHKKLARDEERSSIQLQQLECHLLGDIEERTETVKPFQLHKDFDHLQSYRITRLNHDFHEKMKEVLKKISKMDSQGRLDFSIR